ncbi:EboA domain-containing protein [Azospirillum sp. B510]|uniref:EboA domain-containing protein n=1 Tax=Azospirillum sp. (strain B510) TaxID=137722 RepID=UPI0002FB4D6E|nr:EboA domain-containing protein [Azospirillum sp. B510]
MMADPTMLPTASPDAMPAILIARVAEHDRKAAAWLDAALADPPLPGTPDFMRLFAIAGRKLGGTASPGWPPARTARAALLAAAVHAAGAEAPARLATAFRRSDTTERAAILQSLMLLPDPARFADLAADACRSSVQPVFEAIACDNRFPAVHFAEPVFNQMVLKAVFTGAPLARVAGLAERMTNGLRRMAADFRDERRAAGRPVPADLDLLLDLGSRHDEAL